MFYWDWSAAAWNLWMITLRSFDCSLERDRTALGQTDVTSGDIRWSRNQPAASEYPIGLDLGNLVFSKRKSKGIAEWRWSSHAAGFFRQLIIRATEVARPARYNYAKQIRIKSLKFKCHAGRCWVIRQLLSGSSRDSDFKIQNKKNEFCREIPIGSFAFHCWDFCVASIGNWPWWLCGRFESMSVNLAEIQLQLEVMSPARITWDSCGSKCMPI